ncbi:MAG: 3-deoxy-7-phosphoheptulonate synthase [Planctomycetota bacterium]
MSETAPAERLCVAATPEVCFGPGRFVVIAGPCAVESAAQVRAAARAVAAAGAGMLRGGAFKPRTSPHSFQGLGPGGLRLLAEAGAEVGLPVVTEVLDPRDVGLVARSAAMLQVGSRNMQNFSLLRELGQLGAPVLLKRGAAATLDELLGAAEYLAAAGNQRIVLCERGLRSFDPGVRFTLDLTAVARLAARCPWPVVVDPSHGTGDAALVPALARAAVAVGADALMIEVHPEPAAARSDGPQALRPADFRDLMADLSRWISVAGRVLERPMAGGGPAPRAEQRAKARAT